MYEDPFNSEERISFIDAIKTYTYLAAITIGWNDEIESIEVRKVIQSFGM